jgi:hypothetical protein
VPLRSGRLQVDALATRHGGSLELAASTSSFVKKWNAEESRSDPSAGHTVQLWGCEPPSTLRTA